MGGTFDPVHHAHLALARTARDQLGLARVLWIPAGQPPHRAAPLAAASHRRAMVQAAIAGTAGFELDGSEVANLTPGYSVHTLLRLREQLGTAIPLVLLMGADAFLGLPGWHRWREILALAHVAVATRPGFPLDAVAPPLSDVLASRRSVADEAGANFATAAGRIFTFELAAGTVSATEVRRQIAADAPDAQLLALLPAPVLDYVRRHSLYSA